MTTYTHVLKTGSIQVTGNITVWRCTNILPTNVLPRREMLYLKEIHTYITSNNEGGTEYRVREQDKRVEGKGGRGSRKLSQPAVLCLTEREAAAACTPLHPISCQRCNLAVYE